MARVHKLTDGTNEIDLTSTTDFYDLYDYVPVLPDIPGDGSIPPYVVEVIPVRVTGTSDDNFAAQLQEFHLLQKTAAEYWLDPQQTTPVWYHQSLTNETGERRALVKSLKLEFANEAGNLFSPAPATTEGKLARIIVERHPYWEATSAIAMNAATPSAAASVIYDHTNVSNPVGDISARLEYFRFYSDSGGDPIDRVWVGFRSDSKYGGTASDYPIIWECEDGSNNASESGITDDAASDTNGASPGGGSGAFVELVETDLDWDDGTWRRVCTLRLSTALSSGDNADFYGTHLFLLRAECSAASTTWRLQLRAGYPGTFDNSTSTNGPTFEVTATSWDYHECGLFTFPPRSLQAQPVSRHAEGYDDRYDVGIYAQRTAGSGNLHLDCLCPVPVDEGFFKVEGMDIPSTAVGYADVGVSPLDRFYAVTVEGATSTFAEFPTPSPTNVAVPVGEGRTIIVYARASSSDLTDVVLVNTGNTGAYIPRWVSLRGGE